MSATRTRPARLAGLWYPEDGERIRAFANSAWEQELAPSALERAWAAIVPHAGWNYSGSLALRALQRLVELAGAPVRCLLLGAVHVGGVSMPSLGEDAAWATPLGDLPVDREFEEELLAAGLVRRTFRPHRDEHSLEVLAPMLRLLAPELRIVPILVPPDPRARTLGRRLAELPIAGASIAVASSDLTHYGPRFGGYAPAGLGREGVQWSGRRDQAFLDAVRALDAAEVLELAQRTRCACGAGAVAAAIEFARASGADCGQRLEHTHSHRVVGIPDDEAVDFVGYGTVLLGER